MRSYRSLVMLVALLAVLAMPVCTTFAGSGKPRAITDAGLFALPQDVFPSTKYVNSHTAEAAIMGAEGSFTVGQPTSLDWVGIWVAVGGLLPNATYRAYLDSTGVIVGDLSTAGPCTFKGTFTTDATGNGVFYYEVLDLAPGTYAWSLYINKIAYDRNGKLVVNNTVLISENLDFTIE